MIRDPLYAGHMPSDLLGRIFLSGGLDSSAQGHSSILYIRRDRLLGQFGILRETLAHHRPDLQIGHAFAEAFGFKVARRRRIDP